MVANFKPSDSQRQFINSDARFCALISGRGGGKSASGAQKAMLKIREGKDGMVINPDFENFKLSTWAELRNWIDWNMVIPAQRFRKNPEWQPHAPFVMVFLNDVKVYCKGLRSPDSARGNNVNWFWYDEGGRDEAGLGWRIANAAVRVGDSPQSWVTATPRGTSHWLYKTFVEQYFSEEVKQELAKSLGDRKIVEAFFTSIMDNRDNLSSDFYASMMANYPSGWLREQELNGRFIDEGSTMGKREWFSGKVVAVVPNEIKKRVRYWDLAATEKKVIGKRGGMNDPDTSVGTLLCQDSMNRYYIENQVGVQESWAGIKRTLVDVARLDGPKVHIFIEIEPGSGGTNQIAEIASLPELAGFTIKGHDPKRKGDKVYRAQVWFSKAELGLVYLVHGTWINTFLDQVASFPAGAHDDYVDSVSGAFAVISPFKLWSKTEFNTL